MLVIIVYMLISITVTLISIHKMHKYNAYNVCLFNSSPLHFNTDFDDMRSSAAEKGHDKQAREEEAFLGFLDKPNRKDDANVTPQRPELSRDDEDSQKMDDGDDVIMTKCPASLATAADDGDEVSAWNVQEESRTDRG